MTIGIFALLIMLGAPLMLGAGIVRAIGVSSRDGRLAFIGWAWMAGSLALALLIDIALWLELPLRATVIGSAVAAAIVASWWFPRLTRRRERQATIATAAIAPPPDGSRFGRAAFAVAVVFVLFLTFDRSLIANASVVFFGDEMWIWNGKAQALFTAGGFNAALARAAAELRLSHPDYPPLVSHSALWTYLFTGGVNFVKVRLTAQCTVAALLLIAGAALRRRVAPGVAAVLLFLLATTHTLSLATSRCSGDGYVALGFLAALDAWLRFEETGARRWWRWLCVSLAFAVFSKNEGDLYLLALAGGIVVAALFQPPIRVRLKKLRGAWVVAPLPLLLIGVQWLANARSGFANDFAGGKHDDSLWKMLPGRLQSSVFTKILGAYWTTMTTTTLPPNDGRPWFTQPSDQNLLMLLALVLALLAPRRTLRGPRCVVAAAVIFSLAGMAVIYVGTPHDVDWHLFFSVDRVLGQIVPAATLLLAQTLNERLHDHRALRLQAFHGDDSGTQPSGP